MHYMHSLEKCMHASISKLACMHESMKGGMEGGPGGGEGPPGCTRACTLVKEYCFDVLDHVPSSNSCFFL